MSTSNNTYRGKLVMASGVFDLLHPGHIHYLEEAKKMGDRLVVIIANDQVARKAKDEMIFDVESRCHMVASLRCVDKAIVAANAQRREFYRTIIDLNPDILALGHDQAFDEKELAKELADHGWRGRIVRIGKYPGGEISSSKLKNRIKAQSL